MIRRRHAEAFIAALCFAGCLALAAVVNCATVPAGGTPTPVQAFTGCTTTAVRTAAEGLLGDVTTALATGGYETAIADLALKFGGPEISCAVQLVASEFSAKAAHADDAQVGVVNAHAATWLTEHVR